MQKKERENENFEDFDSFFFEKAWVCTQESGKSV